MKIAVLSKTDESTLLHLLREIRIQRQDAAADTWELKLQTDLEFGVL